MRVIKEYDKRRSEILSVAMKLFGSKGYNKTTINDILKEVQIAKGTFYYYFKSKEEVLDAIIESISDRAVAQVKVSYERQDLTPEEKIVEAVLALNVKSPENEEMLEELHEAENALMHQKSLNQLVTKVSPVLASIMEEGMAQGRFNTQYPQELAEFFLASAMTITDEGILGYTEEKQLKMIQVLIYALETLLGVKQGTFSEILNRK